MTIDCGADGAFALKVLQALIARDVFVRKPMAPGLDRCIRVSVGLDREMDIFAEELPQRAAARAARIGQRWRTIGSAVRVRITGRVQGVYFRGWTRDEAARLGLDGWVRNEADGSVTALIAGPAAERGRHDRAAASGAACGGGGEGRRRGG